MIKNMLTIRYAFLFLFGILSFSPVMAQVPDINEFVFVDSEPKPLNLDSVRSKIGYPDEAVLANQEGTVVVRILVDEKGAYVRHQVVREIHPALAEAVEEHISELEFSPAMQNGAPIMFWTNLPFPFKLIQSDDLAKEKIALFTEQLSAEPEDYKLWHKRGIQYLQLSDYDHAVVDFTESLSFNPRKNKKSAKKNTYEYLFYAFYARAVALSGLEKGEEALVDYSEAIRIADEMAIPDSAVAATLADVYLERAYQYLELEKYSASIADYKKALTMLDSARSCDTWSFVVEAALASDNFPVLVEGYDALIDCNDAAKEIYYYSRAYYRRRAGDYTQAILDFRTAIEKTENPALKMAARNYLALSQLDAGLPADAQTTIDAAIQANALNPMSYFVRAQIKRKMEGPEMACEDLKRSLIYGLAGEEMDLAKQQLKEICGEEWEE